ncbi:MAG: hypothetical protein M1821_001539 [Bathelium mastoideum]|nr:MAG: hypothetical protein M1821_001539 [Bathelium mastoideum]
MAGEQQPQKLLDFAEPPLIYILPTHMTNDDFHAVVGKLEQLQASQTYDISEARLILAQVIKKRRAEYEMRCRNLWTEEITRTTQDIDNPGAPAQKSLKRRKLERAAIEPKDFNSVIILDTSSTESESESEKRRRPGPIDRGSHSILDNWTSQAGDGTKEVRHTGDSSTESEQDLIANLDVVEEEKSARPSAPTLRTEAFQEPSPAHHSILPLSDTIKVISIEWLHESFRLKQFLPVENYMIYEGKKIARPVECDSILEASRAQPVKALLPQEPSALPGIRGDAISARNKAILERAKADMEAELAKRSQLNRRVAGKLATNLQHQTTSEHDYGVSSELPETPEWVKQHVKYACERSTPKDGPNRLFISELKKIKLTRLLTVDEIGVRAYSTSIASIAAYPYPITSSREIVMLPGCDVKIANLWVEFKNKGYIEAAKEADNDEVLSTLRLFYNIWGVGATTARSFYYDRRWRDLDDVVEYGWSTLNREQQIGVKYYEEFLDKIPRQEVEQIAHTIHKHAVAARDNRIQSLVVGGYRRGNEGSGDVDIIISHPEQEHTLNLVHDIVYKLEASGYVTHTLQLKLTNSHREQSTLPYRVGRGGHGFDSLDKALVVWQDPSCSPESLDGATDTNAKNLKPHRRVDIIVSPWHTVGCAVMGWSGGTTFQRDLRRYAKHVKGWKFDSSGVRDRQTGNLVDLQGNGDAVTSMVEAERRVFEGFSLAYREPWERCTG